MSAVGSPGSQTHQQLELAVLADAAGRAVDGADVVAEGLAGPPHGLRDLLQVAYLVGRVQVRHSLLCGEREQREAGRQRPRSHFHFGLDNQSN